jgi:hypothetical protein
MPRLMLGLLPSLVVAQVAAAQSAVIGGTVLRDSTDKPVGDTQVSIPALNRTSRTSYLGEFRFDNLQAGTYVLVFRHVGFQPRTDTITVKAGQLSDGEFILTSAPVELGAQQTVATNALPAFPAQQEFDARKKLGFGHFVTDSMLRKDADNHNFATYIAGRIPGVHLVDSGPSQYLASGRKACTGPAFQCAGSVPCYMTIYIDGVAAYVSGVSNSGPFDFGELKAEDFAAIEYYASGATAPSRFNQTGGDCGILLLWRRYRAP